MRIENEKKKKNQISALQIYVLGDTNSPLTHSSFSEFQFI